MLNLRTLSPPRWCNQDLLRRTHKETCESSYIIRGNGMHSLCVHIAAEQSGAGRERPTYLASPSMAHVVREVLRKCALACDHGASQKGRNVSMLPSEAARPAGDGSQGAAASSQHVRS
eukprot:3409402-Prymnesium_polylepis.1